MLFLSLATLLSITSFAAAQSSAVAPGSTASTAGNSTVTADATPPVCAATCFGSTISTSGCASQTDLLCLCKSDTFIAALYKCVQTTCPVSDIPNAVAFGVGGCATVGVTIALPGAASSSVASVAPKASAGITAAPSSTAAGVVAAPKTTSGANKLSIGSTIVTVVVVALLSV